MKKVIKFISSLLIILLFLLNSTSTTFAVVELNAPPKMVYRST